jgi:hypothetical protein
MTDHGRVVNVIGPPAPRPCESCPYRRDVPSGVWAAEEYEKLERYDNDTIEQPIAVWTCHQTDRDSPQRRVCAGWAECHDGDNLLALRMARGAGVITGETAQAIVDYVSPVPLFDCAVDAAEHALAEIEHPRQRARAMSAKVTRARSDLLD